MSATSIGAATTVPTGSTSSPTFPSLAVPPQQNPNTSIDMPPLVSINHLVNTSDAGVIATVSAVSSARWNSSDGQPWTEDPNNSSPTKSAPILLRIVTVVVDRVLYSSAKLQVNVGDTLQLTSSGDGTNSGAMLDGDPTDRWNQVDGDFVAGDQQLLLLSSVEFPYEAGPEQAVVLSEGRSANWILSQSAAVSTVLGRTVASDALISRILSERQAGLIAQTPDDAAATAVNPLG